MEIQVTLFVIIMLQLNSLTQTKDYDNDGLHPQLGLRGSLSQYGDFVNTPREGEWIDWNANAQQSLSKALERTRRVQEINHQARNGIFLMGDGLGITTVTAARVYVSQSRNLTSDESVLSFEKMPYAALSKTYSTDQVTTDSAVGASAMMCGEKARFGVVCVNQYTLRGNCSSSQGNHLTSIMHEAIAAGKWTGLITTDSVTGASSAPNYAHTPERNWETDDNVPEEEKECPDIGSQLIDIDMNKNIRVILGGGRKHLTPDTFQDPEYPEQYGYRKDDRNLIQEWKAIREEQNPGRWAYVENITDFNNIDPSKTDYLMGLFNPIKMQRDINRLNPEVENWGEPSLAEMVEKAIQILSRNENGYFLFVEGAQIDNAHHENNAFGAVNETAALSDAVSVAMTMTEEDDTLIAVTGDHSHVLTISGYPAINTNILGYNYDFFNWGYQIADDGKPYTTLSYTNGPGYYEHRTENGSLSTWKSRKNVTDERDTLDDPKVKQDSPVPLNTDTHAGEDLGIYSRGPMSFLFQGAQEQSYIAHVFKHSLCLGDYANEGLCPRQEPVACGAGGAHDANRLPYQLFVLSLLFTVILL